MTCQQKLEAWVQSKHRDQVKKYNGKPYYTHLKAVAEMAKEAIARGYEIGLCHDLLEDTSTTENELLESLLNFCYWPEEAEYITNCVVELTDIFTSKAYPDLSRESRKENEALRLATISSAAQTVKYCDLIDNMKLVIEYDTEHAWQYLQKKKSLLEALDKGDANLHKQALQIIHAFQ